MDRATGVIGRPILLGAFGDSGGIHSRIHIFPKTYIYFYEHLRIKLTPSDFSTKVGQEWYPYDSWEFLGNSLVACVAMVVGYIAFDPC